MNKRLVERLNLLLARLGSRSQRHRKATDASPALFVETMESRRLLATNVAPVLNRNASPAFYNVVEDAPAPVGKVGTPIGVLVDFAKPAGQRDNVTDANANALLGIAVIGAKTTNGTWYYTINNGTNWYSLGNRSVASAMLLAADANTRIYFQPKIDFNGTDLTSFSFRAWDRTTGRNGSIGSTTTSGGATAYSTVADTAAVTVAPVNDAPKLDASKTPVLNPVAEDAGVPVGTAGTLVSSLVDFAVPTGQRDNVTDIDAGAKLGIAVVAADTTNGSWYFSLNNGSSWFPLEAVKNNNAQLFAADAGTRIYFRPAGNFNGTANLTFRAWDQTTGFNGGLANTSSGGKTTAFSTATDTAAVTVTPVNDVPVVIYGGLNVPLQTYGTPFAFSGAYKISLADIDTPASGLLGVALAASAGTLDLTLNGATVQAGSLSNGNVTLKGTLAQLNAALATLVYTLPVTGATTTLTITPSEGASTGAARSISVPLTNDIAPTITGPTSVSVTQGVVLPLNTVINRIQIDDVDGGTTNQTITLSVTSGLMNISAYAGGSYAIVGGANDSANLVIRGTPTNMNAVLATLKYTAPSTGTSATLAVTVDDGILKTSYSLPITLIADKAPTLTGPSTASVTQGVLLAFNNVGNRIQMSDVDGASVQQTVTLSVTSGRLNVYGYAGSGGYAIVGGANDTASITIRGIPADMNAVLATLKFTAPNSGSTAVLTVQVTDGILSSAPLKVTITLIADIAPTLIGPTTASVTQGVVLPFTGGNLFTMADVDGGTVKQTLSMSVTAGTLNVYAYAGSGGYAIVAGANDSSSITISGSPTDINAVLATLKYTAPSTGTQDVLSLQVSDGILSSQLLQTTITLIADQAPTVTGPASVDAVSGQVLALSGANLIQMQDADGTTVTQSCTISVTAGTLDIYQYAGSGVTITGGADNTSSITFSGKPDGINSVLATLKYSAPNSSQVATLTVQVSDGILLSNELSVTINVSVAVP